MLFLKQSTASQEVLLGPFVDDTDGKTAETGLTIANTDIKLWLSGATTLASKNSGGATHISNGNYYAVLDATDTATIGPGEIIVQVSGALPVRRDFTVLHANVFDWLFGSGVPSTASASDLTAVKTQTDKFVFTVAGYVDANARKVGGTDQTGRDIGASVLLSSGTGTGQVLLTSGQVHVVSNVKKNQALANYPFRMFTTSGAAMTGATVTARRRLDAGAFGACANAVVELSEGDYKINLAAGDLNGDTIELEFSAAGGRTLPITIVTVP